MAKVLYGLHTVIYSASLDCCANIILFFSLWMCSLHFIKFFLPF
jgi:hypothetical protein